MTEKMSREVTGRRGALWAITAGGLSAGVLDLLVACIQLGWDTPLLIAEGVLGPRAQHGGAGTWLLGVLLHFFIAFSVTAVYYAISRKLVLLITHPVLCGLFYGAAITWVMDAIVIPFSRIHAPGFNNYHDLLQGMFPHMVLVGLPVAFSVQRFGEPKRISVVRPDEIADERS